MEHQDIFSVPDADPDYVYRWLNRQDRNMVLGIQKGWEVVMGAPEIPPSIRAQFQGVTGQAAPVGNPDEIRTRGDLILCRMKKDLYEERVVGPIRERRARHSSSLDTLVEQANDQARYSLARSRVGNIRDRHVFTTTDDSKFEQTGEQAGRQKSR